MWRYAVLLETLLLIAMIGRRTHLRWPGLVAFLGSLVARDAVLLWADWIGAQPLYCYAYYIGSAIADIGQVWLILDISLNLVGPLKTLRGILMRNVPAMTSVFVLGTIVASFPQHPAGIISRIETVGYYCRRLDLAAAVGCSCALIMLMGIAISLKIQFTHGVRPVAIGLLIETGFAYIQAVAHMDGYVAQAAFPAVRFVAYLITLFCFTPPAWTGRNLRTPSSTSPDIEKTRSTGLCCI